MTAERLGDDLGHLEPMQVIGGGPAGLVYEAFDPRLGRTVALKTYRLEAMDPQAADAFVERLRADTEAAAALKHPNIVEVYGCERSGQTASLAMEFVQGEMLAQHLARAGQRPPLQALALVAQLASALEHAQGQGLAHGRIAPEHLLVSRTGQLKLAGFGLPAAREQAFEADLAGMATLAHQLFTGVAPADPRTGLPPPHQLRPELPAALDGVFARALAPDPQSRYRRPAELFDAMRTAFEPPLWERPEKAAPVAPAIQPRVAQPAAVAPIASAKAPAVKRPQPVAPARGRNRLAVVAAALVGVLVAGGVVLSGAFGDRRAGTAELEQIAAAPGPASTTSPADTPSSTVPTTPPTPEAVQAAPQAPVAAVQPDARPVTPAPARVRAPETAATDLDGQPTPRAAEPQRARERVAEATPAPAPVAAREEPAPSRVATPAVPSAEASAVRREPDNTTAAATAPSASPVAPAPVAAAAPAAPAQPTAPAVPTATAGTNTAGAGPSPSVPAPAAATAAAATPAPAPAPAGTSVASIEQRPPAASDGSQVVIRAVVRNERPSASNDPEAACRHQQLLIAREVCNVAQCQEPQWRNHPTCVRRLAEQRQRDAQADEALRTQ